MPFSGTGVYTPAAGALTAAPGGIIRSSVWNAIFTDMTAAFTSTAQSRFLLNTLTPTGVATAGDTTSLTSTFKDYEIVFENLIPATTGSFLEFQVHSGGIFQATSYVNSSFGTNGTTTIINTAATTTYIPLTCAALTTFSISGSIKIYGPVSQSTVGKFVTGSTSGLNASALATVVSGAWTPATAIDGFQLLFSTGNITSGTIKVYGLA